MAVIVTVTETTGNEITVTTDQVVITTNSVAVGDAGDISFTPVGTITATNIQDALHQIADQKFVQTTAPAVSDNNLEEGDLWYNTTDNKLMVYRNTTWEEITLGAQLSESSGTAEYSDVTLNGGYF
jgi:prolyl-tRNA synthetase